MLLLHYAVLPRLIGKGSRGLGSCGHEASQLPGTAAALEIGALDGTCTHTLPADNGLLFYSATRAKWWEALVTLQFVASDFV